MFIRPPSALRLGSGSQLIGSRDFSGKLPFSESAGGKIKRSRHMTAPFTTLQRNVF